MSTLFDRAKHVIDALIPLAASLIKTGESVDSVVKQRLRALSRGYESGLLTVGRSPIDYSRTTTHIAYFYRTFAAHADWVFKALESASIEITNQLTVDPVRVACIGGGPGSDIAGVLKFAQRNDLQSRSFHFTTLDREPAWGRSRRELLRTYAQEVNVTGSFEALDLTAGSPWTHDWSFANADLFTFAFSLSEVWSFNRSRSVSLFLDRLIQSARVGAIFCYVDNGGASFTPLIEQELSVRDDLTLLVSQDEDRMLMSFDEQCDVLTRHHKDRFAQNLKLTGNVALRVWKKE